MVIGGGIIIKKISDRWLFVPILILGINLIIRLIDQSKMIKMFPLDFTNDYSSYIARFFFFIKCGFHNFCPYWYNGFIAFKSFSLGWVLFTLPWYWLSNNILFSIYASTISMYILGFVFFYILGKTQGFSLIQIVAYFFFFFANAITLGNFLRLGRTVSMWGFVLMIGMAVLVLYYKNHRLDKKFFLYFIPLYTIILFSHQTEMFFSQIFVLCLFLVRKNKEKVYIILSAIVGFLLASFWMVPFLLELKRVSMFGYLDSVKGWLFSGPHLLTNIAGIIIPIVLFVSFYFYWKTCNKSRKEVLFFSPVLLLGVLFLLRLTPFIIVLRNIPPDPYLTFFIFLIAFYFLKTKFENIKLRNITIILLFIVCVISVVITNIHTPFFVEHGPLEEEVISVFPFVEGRYIMIAGENSTSYGNAYYTYAAIYYNLTTAGGWYPHMIPKNYLDELNSIYSFYNKKDCRNFVEKLNSLNVDEVILYGAKCDEVIACGLKKKKIMENVCLYKVL